MERKEEKLNQLLNRKREYEQSKKSLIAEKEIHTIIDNLTDNQLTKSCEYFGITAKSRTGQLNRVKRFTYLVLDCVNGFTEELKAITLYEYYKNNNKDEIRKFISYYYPTQKFAFLNTQLLSFSDLNLRTIFEFAGYDFFKTIINPTNNDMNSISLTREENRLINVDYIYPQRVLDELKKPKFFDYTKMVNVEKIIANGQTNDSVLIKSFPYFSKLQELILKNGYFCDYAFLTKVLNLTYLNIDADIYVDGCLNAKEEAELKRIDNIEDVQTRTMRLNEFQDIIADRQRKTINLNFKNSLTSLKNLQTIILNVFEIHDDDLKFLITNFPKLTNLKLYNIKIAKTIGIPQNIKVEIFSKNILPLIGINRYEFIKENEIEYYYKNFNPPYIQKILFGYKERGDSYILIRHKAIIKFSYTHSKIIPIVYVDPDTLPDRLVLHAFSALRKFNPSISNTNRLQIVREKLYEISYIPSDFTKFVYEKISF